MERTAFDQLYADYAADIHRFALWLTGSEQSASDIVAETFLRAWTSGSPLRTATARSYLLAIARNLATDEHRHRNRQVPLADSFHSRELAPDRLAWLNQILREIRRLPETYGLPLLLYGAGGLTYDEIGAYLSLPVATVKIRIHRARLMLADALEPAPKEIKP
jgi:RNA polymerase sigma-70 factor (ECF subfamily)